ncbi:unnamed protein product, partial [Sphagnum compactum]
MDDCPICSELGIGCRVACHPSASSAGSAREHDENEMVSGQLFMDTVFDGVKRKVAKLMFRCGLVGQIEKQKSATSNEVGTLVRFLCTRKESRQFIHFIAKLSRDHDNFGMHYFLDANLARYNANVTINASA